MVTGTDARNEEGKFVRWGVNLREALGYSTLYAMVISLALLGDHVVQTGFEGSRFLGVGYFVPVVAAVFVLNVAMRAIGIAEVVAERLGPPVRINFAVCVVLGVALLVL